MSDLFTVRMVRKQIISTFDTLGRKIGERIEEIAVVFHDLPHATASGYAQNFPDAKVKISKQEPVFGRGDKRESVFGPVRRPPYERRHEGDGGTKYRAPAPKTSSTVEAATSGDFAAAINAELKERS